MTVVKFYSHSSTIFAQVNSVVKLYGMQWRCLDLCARYIETALVCALPVFAPSLIPVTWSKQKFFFGLGTARHFPYTVILPISDTSHGSELLPVSGLNPRGEVGPGINGGAEGS